MVGLGDVYSCALHVRVCVFDPDAGCRDQSHSLLSKSKRDGTFLVRSKNPKPGDNHTHTVDIL